MRGAVVSELAVLTTPLGGPPLARLAGDGGAPAGWYRAQPRSAGAWRGEAEAVRAEYAGRDWVRTLAPAFEPSGPAAARLRRVADAGGIVVTTGQQPGLFGGPVYTWNKALSAIALADALERATGIPTAPVFWAATYDADFAEASASYVALGPTVQRLQMQPPLEEGRRMRDLPLGDVSALARELERAAGSAADPQVLALVARAYGPGETVGSCVL
ncbi:MAG: bacillithiol biosynthesis BshC [Gemmatimonadaceae bacterium]|nr:bacillithiol biosynthesis BshC [Gemmatimonadaceae bacterium]